MDVKAKCVATRKGCHVDVAVNATDVPSVATGAIRVLGVVESEPPHVGIDVTVRLAHQGTVRLHGCGADISRAARPEDWRSRTRPSALEPGGRCHWRIDVVHRELDDVRIRGRKVVELHEILRSHVATRPAFRGRHLIRPVHTIDGGGDDVRYCGPLVSTTLQADDEMAEVLRIRRRLVDGVSPRGTATRLRNLKANGVGAGIFAMVRGGRDQGSMASIDGEPCHEEKRNQDRA